METSACLDGSDQTFLNKNFPNRPQCVLDRSFWIFFENFKNFRVDKFFQNRSKGGTHLYKNQKNQKRHFFCCKSYFFYLNMNSTCSQLSFEVSNMSVAQNFSNFTFFCQILTKIICRPKFLKFLKNFQKMTWPGPFKCLK